MKRLITMCAVVVMLLCTYASADIQYATGTGGGIWYYPNSGTVGTEFEANRNLTLSMLGIWDENGDGLSDAHDVALFATDGTLLASVTIAAGTSNPLVNGYRWADAAPVALVQGTHYVLGAFYPDGDDRFKDRATIDPAFTLVKDLYRDGAPFDIPTTEYFYDGRGWYGPNLQAVPIPAAVLLGLLGLGAAGVKLRKHA